MSQSSDLRLKLEDAVKTNRQQLQRHNKTIEPEKQQFKVPAPSIKLKTDFSNFN